jgi:hypothetical protein
MKATTELCINLLDLTSHVPVSWLQYQFRALFRFPELNFGHTDSELGSSLSSSQFAQYIRGRFQFIVIAVVFNKATYIYYSGRDHCVVNMANKVATVIANETGQGLTMKVGNRNCFVKLASVKNGSEYTMRLRVDWTYQEFLLEDNHNTGKKIFVNSDDCCDYERIMFVC